MNKISLKKVSEILSENEMKKVLGGITDCWEFYCMMQPYYNAPQNLYSGLR
jgi:natural product precursor